MVRRQKKDVLAQLPAKRRQTLWFSLAPRAAKEMRTRMERKDKLKKIVAHPNRSEKEKAAAEAESRQMLGQLYKDTGVQKCEVDPPPLSAPSAAGAEPTGRVCSGSSHTSRI